MVVLLWVFAFVCFVVAFMTSAFQIGTGRTHWVALGLAFAAATHVPWPH